MRFDNPKVNNYKHYGGRGISYDKNWKGFKNFLKDMGEKPEGKTIDRIDVNKGYYKENCRWVDWSTQNSNKRTALVIEYEGEKNSLHFWANKCKLSYMALYNRIYIYKWTLKDALTRPRRKKIINMS